MSLSPLFGFASCLVALTILMAIPAGDSFVVPVDFSRTPRGVCRPHSSSTPVVLPRRRQTATTTATRLSDMKRPILDQIASTLFRWENQRVADSSVVDDQGRVGEPMEWSQETSTANRFSELVAKNPIGYQMKQWVADIVAGSNYDRESVQTTIDQFVHESDIAMFSFTTCPFCRRAKDALDERGITYAVMELDELEGNKGNEIRAELGRKTKRTSVPSIFVRGRYIGGCNDGPGLLPIMESGEFDKMLQE